MRAQTARFDEHSVLHELKHYLPAQAPLKDFIHHNTLHAFQSQQFDDGLRSASEIFGYKVSLSLAEFRGLYTAGRISAPVLERIITTQKGAKNQLAWRNKVVFEQYDTSNTPRIGTLRSHWKTQYKIDLDSLVHPILFRILCSYLDQGISIWRFPVGKTGFLAAIKEMESHSFVSYFRTKRAKNLLLNTDCNLTDLLELLVGDAALFEHYLFDQQFAHQGWSGMVSAIEDQPQTLLDRREVTLRDLIAFELLLEIDALDYQFDQNWLALSNVVKIPPAPLFADVPATELHQVMAIWQQAFEWSYYDQVLAGIQQETNFPARAAGKPSFQAMFCIDDRECSLRRYLEKNDTHCETFGTAGFFGVEFFYQPEGGKFYTKVCPAPVTPKFLIKESDGSNKDKLKKDLYFNNHAHSFYGGWLIAQTLGFWAAFRLFLNIFRPSMSPATASSFKHMDKFSKLTIENHNHEHENELQVGFQVEEMANRVEGLLKSIGLVSDFAPIVYVIGHGASSVNNPHYAAYDCGACSGRAGSVNSRVISYMANHPKVRQILVERGIVIPFETQFVGGLHDTTRDEVAFYDESALSPQNQQRHQANHLVFDKALDLNAKERSRRFESIDTSLSAAQIHEKVRVRSVSLFEPRPELNHATNALCIVGRRGLSKGVFLDRRSFLNSYNYQIDLDGKYLLNILKAVAPVCGGINLEYFFSRVDNQKLGAGTKLPHNVMGLFGVANGIDGDLRPGLPSQMVEVHDPVRLLVIVEHFDDVVLTTIQKSPETYEWFINEWVRLVAVHPQTKALSVFENGHFVAYTPTPQHLNTIKDIEPLLTSTQENFPVYLLS